jgi:hypothetical protein
VAKAASTVGTPKILSLSHAATSFYGAEKGRHPNIIISPLPTNLCALTRPANLVVSPGVKAHIDPLSDICEYLLLRPVN